MEKAIRAIRDSKMGWLLASKTFGVPQPTLRRHVLGTNKTLESNSKGLGGWKATFTPDVERQLVEHIKLLESRLFGLTRASLQELFANCANNSIYFLICHFVHCGLISLEYFLFFFC